MRTSQKVKKQLVVLSAPSGAGKTTLARYLLEQFPHFNFSISVTTRTPRAGEVHGKDYYFVTKEEFQKLITYDKLVEWEEIFGNYYGTLKSEIQSRIENGEIVLFDIDVKGALSIKKNFPAPSLLIFIMPPSKDVLVERLKNRRTESPEQLAERLKRIDMELSLANQFDYIVVNDDLEQAKKELVKILKENGVVL